MPDYRTVDKTEWFIQHMRSGWFSRREIVGIAAKEFRASRRRRWMDHRSILVGQRQSKVGNVQAIHTRGLKVVENAGKRSIVEDSGAVSLPVANDWDSTLKECSAPARAPADMQVQSDRTREMWNTNDLDLWHKALNRYWTFVKPSNLALEKRSTNWMPKPLGQ